MLTILIKQSLDKWFLRDDCNYKISHLKKYSQLITTAVFHITQVSYYSPYLLTLNPNQIYVKR